MARAAGVHEDKSLSIVPADRVHVLRILEVALLVTLPLVFSAVGYSILYLLLGGGVGGAVLIFLIAKMLRR